MYNRIIYFKKSLMVKHLGAEHREKMVNGIKNGLEEVWKTVPKAELKLSHGITSLIFYATELERIIYDEKYLLQTSLYNYRMRIADLIYNLQNNGLRLFKFSPQDLNKLNNSELSSGYVVVETEAGKKNKVKIQELTPSYSPINIIHQQELKKPIAKGSNHEITSATLDDLKKNKLKEIVGESKSMIPCRKCGPSALVLPTSRQTRSADEPETIFLYCTECHARWKIVG